MAYIDWENAREHRLKTHPGPFMAVLKRTKRFEFRKDDRNFRVGDSLQLVHYDPETGRQGQYMRVYITNILSEGFGLPPGYVVLGICYEDEFHHYFDLKGLK